MSKLSDLTQKFSETGLYQFMLKFNTVFLGGILKVVQAIVNAVRPK